MRLRWLFGLSSRLDFTMCLQVAIKKIPKVFDDLVDGKRILREIKLLTYLQHENIISVKVVHPFFLYMFFPSNITLTFFFSSFVVFMFRACCGTPKLLDGSAGSQAASTAARKNLRKQPNTYLKHHDPRAAPASVCRISCPVLLRFLDQNVIQVSLAATQLSSTTLIQHEKEALSVLVSFCNYLALDFRTCFAPARNNSTTYISYRS